MVDYTHHVMDERIASGVPLVKLMAGGHSMVRCDPEPKPYRTMQYLAQLV